MIAGLSLVHLAIIVVVLAACVALVYIALKQFGISVPSWFQQVLWVIVVAIVVIFAIKLVAGML